MELVKELCLFSQNISEIFLVFPMGRNCSRFGTGFSSANNLLLDYPSITNNHRGISFFFHQRWVSYPPLVVVVAIVNYFHYSGWLSNLAGWLKNKIPSGVFSYIPINSKFKSSHWRNFAFVSFEDWQNDVIGMVMWLGNLLSNQVIPGSIPLHKILFIFFLP